MPSIELCCLVVFNLSANVFLSRVSTRDIDIANLSVRLSVCPLRFGIR